ncbi:MAG: hypothetical protein MUC65_09270 [Pontiellaceae bacterium]|nr:hypothetical protein [Pontiellaceae bacterium]
MKKTIWSFALVLFATASGYGVTIPDLVKRVQNDDPKFPPVNVEEFKSLQAAAVEGDALAQAKVVDFSIGHMEVVYAPLQKCGGLLFSVRKPVEKYNDASSNYALNLAAFFEGTTDKVRIKKQKFEVKTKDGFSYLVATPRYRKKEEAIEVTVGTGVQSVPLADLSDADRRFVESALADQAFKSDLKISFEDSRSEGEIEVKDFYTEQTETVSRKIILKNEGELPLENLVLEYQSFVEQMIFRMPKDFPTDYRIAGWIKVPFLAPGETKEFPLDLPSTVAQKPEIIQKGDGRYYRPIPPELNNLGEGRMNGTWVKVYRFTPYGERLERECKSSGSSSGKWDSGKWDCVTPVNDKVE